MPAPSTTTSTSASDIDFPTTLVTAGRSLWNSELIEKGRGAGDGFHRIEYDLYLAINVLSASGYPPQGQVFLFHADCLKDFVKSLFRPGVEFLSGLILQRMRDIDRRRIQSYC